MFTLNEALKIAGLQQLVEAKKTISAPFNGIEKELPNITKAGLTIVGLRVGGGGGHTEADIQGDESAIRAYLAKLWNLDADAEEIDELFEE